MKRCFVFLSWLLAIGCSHVPQRHLGASMSDPSGVVQQTRDVEQRRNNPLYQPTRKIEQFDTKALRELVENMRAVMHATGGIGISANQLGESLQIFIIEAQADNPRYQVLGAVPYAVFINPKIVRASNERRNFWHGCLSAVGEKRGNVATYEWIEYSAADETGHIREGRLDGFDAVIFQHEMRHLLGGTYLDKARMFLDKAELDQKLANHELPFFERADAQLSLLLDDYRIGESLEDYFSRARAV